MPEIREIFSGFTIERVPVTYMIAGGAKAQEVTELIVSKVRAASVARLFED